MSISSGLPDTSTSNRIEATLRKIMLETEVNGDSLLSLFPGREVVYTNRAPRQVVFPYITMLLTRTSLKEYNGYREVWDLEVQFFGRPEGQYPLVNQMADLVDAALTCLTLSSAGLVVGRSRTRQTLPMFATPADIEVVGILSRYSMFAWPQVLTDLRLSKAFSSAFSEAFN